MTFSIKFLIVISLGSELTSVVIIAAVIGILQYFGSITLTESECQSRRWVSRRWAQNTGEVPFCNEWKIICHHRGAFPWHASKGMTSLKWVWKWFQTFCNWTGNVKFAPTVLLSSMISNISGVSMCSVFKLVLHGTVFARMAPNQKTQLIEVLQAVEWVFMSST